MLSFSHMIVDTPDQSFITAYIEGLDKPLMVGSDHPSFGEIRGRLEGAAEARLAGDDYGVSLNLDGLPTLFDIPKMLSEKFRRLSDRFTVKDGTIFRDGDPLDNYFARTVLGLLDEGGDVEPIIAFQERLEANPSNLSKDQALEWFNTHDIQITPEGKLVLYKGVQADPSGEEGRYRSINAGHGFVDGEEFHNSTLPNYVGAEVRMPRSEVTEDAYASCAPGLHCSTWSYAKAWGRGAMLEVLVDPADIGSVPVGAEKIRVCRYVVTDILEQPREGTLTATAYDAPAPFQGVGLLTFSVEDLAEDEVDPYDVEDEPCEYCESEYCEGECEEESYDDPYEYDPFAFSDDLRDQQD